MTAPPYESASDEDLMARTRSGDTEGFGELWRRHSDAARRAAWQFRSVAEPDDLVAEAYVRILDAVRRGRGPRGAFRPYLLVTIRNLVNRMSHAPAAQQVDDLDELVAEATLEDPTVRALDRSLTVSAFRSLPERWQTVLWYTAVEDMSPREIAPLLGLTANSAAALAYRARRGLREAWLQAHVQDEATSPECRWFLARVGSYTAGGLSSRDARRARDHLAGCERCTVIAGEVDDVGSRLALVLIPFLLGPAAGSAYLASSGGAATAASAAGGGSDGGSVSSTGASAGAPAAQAVPAAQTIPAVPAASTAAVTAAGGALAAKLVPAALAVLAASAVVAGTVIATQQPGPLPASAPSASPRDTAEIADAAPPPPPVPEPVPTEGAEETPALPERPPVSPPGAGGPGADGGGSAGPGTDGAVPREPVPGDVDPGGADPDSTDPDSTDPDSTEDGDADPEGTDPGDPGPDTEALAPVVTSPVSDDQTERPSLAGTAEPSAAITVTDQDGAVLAEVTADGEGDWATGPLTALAATTTQLFVGQVDQAGNTSPLTALGPFAFHPVIVGPAGAATCQSGAPAQVELAGWADEPVLYSFALNGDPGPGFLAGYPDADSTLVFQLGCDTSAVAEITLGFYYAGTEPEDGPSIVVRLLP